MLEVAGITVQAWRHVPSHFNKETPFDATVANALAAGGAILIAVFALLAVDVWRSSRELRPSLRLAMKAGFALLGAGLAAGVAMIVRGVALLGQSAVDGRWDDVAYAEAGFLKDFHAVTLHAVLVLPALEAILARLRLPDRVRCRAVVVAVVLYCLGGLAALGRDIVG
ncbi:MAG: hypothetical protein ACRCYU_21760 [Nocardioides sp.]